MIFTVNGNRYRLDEFSLMLDEDPALRSSLYVNFLGMPVGQSEQ